MAHDTARRRLFGTSASVAVGATVGAALGTITGCALSGVAASRPGTPFDCHIDGLPNLGIKIV